MRTHIFSVSKGGALSYEDTLEACKTDDKLAKICDTDEFIHVLKKMLQIPPAKEKIEKSLDQETTSTVETKKSVTRKYSPTSTALMSENSTV